MSPTNTATLFGESCPKCGSDEAWHGVITEPGEDDRFACDECGHWQSITITRTKPPKPVKRRRPFGFSVEVDEKGQVFVEVCRDIVVAFRWGYYLQIGSLNLVTPREEDRLQEMWTKVGRRSARLEATS